MSYFACVWLRTCCWSIPTELCFAKMRGAASTCLCLVHICALFHQYASFRFNILHWYQNYSTNSFGKGTGVLYYRLRVRISLIYSYFHTNYSYLVSVTLLLQKHPCINGGILKQRIRKMILIEMTGALHATPKFIFCGLNGGEIECLSDFIF